MTSSSEGGWAFLETLNKYRMRHTVADGTDKNNMHSYGPHYDELLQPLKAKGADVTLCEIGFCSGAFLQVLHECLPEATIYGLEINTKNAKFGRFNAKIHQLEMDATQTSAFEHFSSANVKFDVVFEDGSHVPSDQVRTYENFATLMKPGGVFIIEDVDGKHLAEVEEDLKIIAEKYGHKVVVHDLRSVKGRYDDILIFVHA